MNNYELIIKIRKEIERRINDANSASDRDITGYYKGVASGLENILSFLSDLESEKPMNPEELEKEIDRFYGMYRKDGKTYVVEDDEECVDWKEMSNPDFEIAFARHFYELGCHHTAEKYDEIEYKRQIAEESEKPVPNDLEEAAEKSLRLAGFHNMETRGMDLKEGFIAGAKWQKEQAEKDPDKQWDKLQSHFKEINEAFEEGKKAMHEQMMKEAVEGEIQMRYSGCLCAKTIRAINEDKFKLGDKVRIIIIKDDGKSD